jgi:hypothetical protein
MSTKYWVGAAVVLSALGIGILGSSTSRAGVLPKPQSPTPTDQSSSDPPFGTFLGACNGDADCTDGNICGSYRKRGSHCTHACNSDNDCAGGPTARCTKQGRCGLNEPVKTEP